MKIIDAEWETFKKATVPDHASPRQVSMMREAFFSGASAAYVKMTKGVGNEPTESSLARVMAIHDELQDFLRNIRIELRAVRAATCNLVGQKLGVS